MRSRLLALAMCLIYLSGCVGGAGRVTSAPASFDEGMAALQRKDFRMASYHFSGLAKDGDPSSMNNLGIALLMANRRDDAIYWFKNAARYGDRNAPSTLSKLNESVPAADLVGKHPSQLASEAQQQALAIVAIGLLIGITGYYIGKAGGSQSNRTAFNDDFSGLGSAGTNSLSNEPSRPTRPSQAASANIQRGSGYEIPQAGPIERDIEVTNIYTREKYKGTVDKFGNVSIHPQYEPGNNYKGTFEDGSAKVKDWSGNEMKIEKRY